MAVSPSVPTPAPDSDDEGFWVEVNFQPPTIIVPSDNASTAELKEVIKRSLLYFAGLFMSSRR